MNPDETKKLLTLQEVANRLSVSIETLLSWNEHHILKPTITISGEVGYTEEQIQHFLSIRQHFSSEIASKINVETPQIQQKKEPEISSVMPVDAKRHHDSPSLRLISGVAIVFIFLMLAIFTQQDSFKVIFNQPEEHDYLDEIVGSQVSTDGKVSKYKLSEKVAVATPIILKDEEEKNLEAEGEDGEGSKNTALNTVFKEPTPTQTPVKTIPAKNPESKLGSKSLIATAASSIAGFTSFASRTIDEGLQSLVFDEKGNLKGETNDGLATALGGSQGTISETIRQDSITPLAQVIFLATGLLAFTFVFPRRFAYTPKVNTQTPEIVPQVMPLVETILEVDQKTDGTIYILFEGRELKVSKPELYSESDQFIERLLEIAKSSGTKEVEYEMLNDSKIRFTTPLSRLVTRLGFVGIKRDLFFPRTSKDRVLFRRLITKADLSDMNLTVEEMLQEFSLIS